MAKYLKVEPLYQFRFIPEILREELSNLWHTSKVHSHSRYERLQWATDWLLKAHPELSRGGIYKDLCCMVEGY